MPGISQAVWGEHKCEQNVQPQALQGIFPRGFSRAVSTDGSFATESSSPT